MKVTDPETMFLYQGDQVLVIVDKQQFVFTIVLFVDGSHRELQLVNRGSKEREAMPLSQTALDSLEPCKDKRAKWKLVL